MFRPGENGTVQPDVTDGDWRVMSSRIMFHVSQPQWGFYNESLAGKVGLEPTGELSDSGAFILLSACHLWRLIRPRVWFIAIVTL